MTHQYKKLPVTITMWMQFNVMPWTYPTMATAKRRRKRQHCSLVEFGPEHVDAEL